MSNKVSAIEKIGGSSLPNDEAYIKHAGFIASRIQKGERLVVVISAQEGYTDKLLYESKRDPSTPVLRQIKYVVQGGEVRSAKLLLSALQDFDIKARVVSYQEIDLIARGHDVFNTDLVGVNAEKLKSFVCRYDVVIVPGYGAIHEKLAGDIGNSVSGKPVRCDPNYVLLGRGATDYVAVALGAVLGCPVRFRKGSGKVYAVDPDILPNALPLDHLSYGQARQFVEYSHQGQQFLDLKCLDLAAYYHVPLYFLPEHEHDHNGSGTRIGVAHDMPHDRQFVTEPFRALAVQDILLYEINVNLPKTPVSLYETLQDAGISCSDFYEANGHTMYDKNRVCFTVQERDFEAAESILKGSLHYQNASFKCASLTLIDSSITPEGNHIFTGRRALEDINILLASSSGTAIRFIVRCYDQEKAIKALAEEFGLTN
jgi:aspartate kinase